VASHLVGNELQRMIQAFSSGEISVATDIHLRLFPLFKALFVTTNPIPVKKALQHQGWQVGSTRPPLCEADAKVTQHLEVVMKELYLL
ncbi:MAG: dihydrodipicolinate synthase family protein, partial [Fischerella sp.]|nr:dihydrodipicolinate synthase family protein [Fischerella sp.]